MATVPSEITHVSDTALLVAGCRAVESEQPDAFVRDPFAARLAGERGIAMFRALPHQVIMGFGVALRTRFVDELLLSALASTSLQTVLSVGCGLDTRPWRLELPQDLRWIEVDFAPMLDYKEQLMVGETLRCRRERLVADVNDPAQRGLIYAAAGSAPALLLTEGLLMYLPAATVRSLTAEARHQTGIIQWITDIRTTSFSKAIGGDGGRVFRHVQADDYLEGEQILETVYQQGWVTAERRSYITDLAFATDRIARIMANAPKGAPPPTFAPDDPTGVHCFARV